MFLSVAVHEPASMATKKILTSTLVLIVLAVAMAAAVPIDLKIQL